MPTANWVPLLEIMTPGSHLCFRQRSGGWRSRWCTSLPLFFIFLGEECDIDINECDSNPCHHAGTCLDQPNGYTCHCPHGWVGANCEIRKYFCCSAAIIQPPIFIHQEEGPTMSSQPHAPSLTLRQWGPEGAPESPRLPSPSAIGFAHRIRPLARLPESEFSISTETRTCRCHPGFGAAKQPKMC